MKKVIAIVVLIGLLGGVLVGKCGGDSVKQTQPIPPVKSAVVVEPPVAKPIPHEGRSATEKEYQAYAKYAQDFSFPEQHLSVESFVRETTSEIGKHFPDTHYLFRTSDLNYVYNVYVKDDPNHALVGCIVPLKMDIPGATNGMQICLITVDTATKKGLIHGVVGVQMTTNALLSAKNAQKLATFCAEQSAKGRKLPKVPNWEIRLVTHWEHFTGDADIIQEDGRFQVASVTLSKEGDMKELHFRTTYFYTDKGETVGPSKAPEEFETIPDKLISR